MQIGDTVFDLSAAQMKKFEEWKKTLPEMNERDAGVQGGLYSFIFTPTGIGTVETVKRKDGYVLDLTEYDKW